MPTSASDLLSAAYNDADRTIDLRRRLHRHPEIGLHLPRDPGRRSSRRSPTCRSRSPPGRRPAPSSPSCAAPGRAPRTCCAATWTRLPVHEDTGLPFASEVPGVDARLRARHPRRDAARRRAAAGRAPRRARRPGRVHGAAGGGGLPRRPLHARGGAARRRPGGAGQRRVRAAHLLDAGQRQRQRAARPADGRRRPVADDRPRARRARLRAAPPRPTRSRWPPRSCWRCSRWSPGGSTSSTPPWSPSRTSRPGSTNNVIPDTAFLEGTIRTLSAERRADVVAVGPAGGHAHRRGARARPSSSSTRRATR